MEIQTPEELNCPICMAPLKIPITTECGHSFCRSCLVNSSKTKKACPMCRQQFQYSPQKLKQDDCLSIILQDLRRKIVNIKKKQQNSFESKSQTMLLLDVKCEKLLLPYNKISVSFQLQNPDLLNKLQKFVARQQSPYNKYGVISRIVSLNKLRHNVYQCILQGKAFCVIQSQKIQQGLSEMDEQYFYRSCNAKEIIESTNVNINDLRGFVDLFKQIKDSQILKKVYRQVDHKVFVNFNDPPAIMYSILGIIKMDEKQKYKIITAFDEESKIQAIKKKVKSIDRDVSYNIDGFLDISKDSGINYFSVIFLVVMFFIIGIINMEQTSQL